MSDMSISKNIAGSGYSTFPPQVETEKRKALR